MADPRRKAIITVGLNDRQLDRDLSAARRKVRKGSDDLARRISGGDQGKKKRAARAGFVAGVVGSATGAVGGFISDTIDGLYAFEDGLSRLQIASGKSNAEMARMRQSILDVSKATGIGQADILAGTQSYVDLTGDIAGAEAAMSSFARIAQASGASVSDVATATAALKESMKLDSGDIEAAFSGLIQQGKAGAVSLKDLASELAAVAPRFAKFGGSGLMGIADLGAALQVTRKGFGSASESATGLEALMGALSLNAGKFQAAGVKIFKVGKGGKKEFRGFVDIIDAIGKSRLMKDPTALTKAWGSKEAAQAFDMLVANRQELEKIYQAGLDTGAVSRDLETRLASPAGKIAAAFNAAKISLAEAFTPERIEKFAQALAVAADYFAKLVGFVDRLAGLLGAGGEQAVSTLGAQALTKGRGHNEARDLVQRAARGEEVDALKGLSPEARKRAAAVAAQQLGLTSTGEETDHWRSKGGAPTGSPADAKAFMDELGRRVQGAIVEGMKGANVEMRTESDKIARTVRNAPSGKAPARGR